MLILTRRKGESLKIGENGEISINLLNISKHHHQVKIGIEAPRDIPVHRTEIWKRIQNEKAIETSNKNT